MLARDLGVAERGVVAFATTVALVVPRVSELGMSSATTVLAARRPDDRPSILANAVVFAVVVGAGGGAAAALVLGPGGAGPGLGVGELAFVAAGMLGNALLDAGYAFLVGVGRLGRWTALAAACPWLYAALLAAMAALGVLTVTRALAAWALAHLVWGLGAVAVAARAGGVGPVSPHLLRESLALGVRAWVGSLSRFLNFRLDQVILGLIAAQATLGLYATAVNLSDVALYLPGAVATAAIPAIARAEAAARGARTLGIFRVVLVLTAVVVAAGMLVGGPLLPVLFGAPYRPAVTPYLVLVPGALGYVASAVFSGALLGSRRPELSSLGPLVSLVVGVALDLLLIPSFGATGAAAAATASFAAGGSAAVAAFRALHPFSWRELVAGPGDAGVVLGLIRRAAVSRRLSF